MPRGLKKGRLTHEHMHRGKILFLNSPIFLPSADHQMLQVRQPERYCPRMSISIRWSFAFTTSLGHCRLFLGKRTNIYPPISRDCDTP